MIFIKLMRKLQRSFLLPELLCEAKEMFRSRCILLGDAVLCGHRLRNAVFCEVDTIQG